MNSLDRMFHARSVAVVGASRDPNKDGYLILNSIVRGGFKGAIYPINPQAGEILGLRAYPSLTEAPKPIDLVVVVVPARFVPGILQEAAATGAGSAVVISAGFREAGRYDLEAELAAISKETGLKFLGPNVQGISYIPNHLCAVLWPVISCKGPVSIISQSGSVTAALSDWAVKDGLGISAGVNLGNQVGLSESDILEYISQDGSTGAIAMYLEGIKDGPRFLEIARRAVKTKPVVILKSGRTESGRLAVASHTGSLAGRDEIFDAACRQIGIQRASETEALYDIAKAMATIKRPSGNRLLVVSSSGGGGALSIDAAEQNGLVVPRLAPALVEELKKLELQPLASLKNPLDLSSELAFYFKRAVPLADEFDAADTILLVFGDPVQDAPDLVRYLAANVRASLAIAYLGGGEIQDQSLVEIQAAGVPVFPTPERAIRGIAAVVRDAQFRKLGKE